MRRGDCAGGRARARAAARNFRVNWARSEATIPRGWERVCLIVRLLSAGGFYDPNGGRKVERQPISGEYGFAEHGRVAAFGRG